MTKGTVEASNSFLMVRPTLESTKAIRLKDRVCTLGPMVKSMKGSGIRVSSMGMESGVVTKAIPTVESGKTGNHTGRVSTIGSTVTGMRASGSILSNTGMAPISSQMATSSQVSTSKACQQERAPTLGTAAPPTQATLSTG